jgi:hypothetical protein
VTALILDSGAERRLLKFRDLGHLLTRLAKMTGSSPRPEP